MDRIEIRKQNKLNKSTSECFFASPQLSPKASNRKKYCNEISETEDENKDHINFESKKKKGKSILMLRKVSNELNNMIEGLNFSKDLRKSSGGNRDSIILESINKENKIFNIYENLIKSNKIEEDNKVQNKHEIWIKSTAIETKIDEITGNKKEMNLKIEEAERKFQDEIEKLEKKIGQNKNSILISKMIEKTKKDKEKAINAIRMEFNESKYF